MINTYYKIYAIGYTGVEKINETYDIKSVQEIIDDLDPVKYYTYLVIEHNIELNMDTPVASGNIDYNLSNKEDKSKRR